MGRKSGLQTPPTIWEIIGGYADPIYASVFPILALNQRLQTSP